jgi:hypothetical protein
MSPRGWLTAWRGNGYGVAINREANACLKHDANHHNQDDCVVY